jgi:hypothetical protein
MNGHERRVTLPPHTPTADGELSAPAQRGRHPMRGHILGHPRTLRPAALVVAAAIGAATLASSANVARADEVSPKGKGIAGGALLGGEVVTILESLIGLRVGWLYGVSALVGAGGGGVGGYFIEKGNTDGKVPTYMLAGGLALFIPAVVLTLNATRYLPEEGATQEGPPTAPAEPGTPGGSVIGAPPDVGTPSPSPTPPPASPSTPSQSPAPPSSPEPAVRPPQSKAAPPARGAGATRAAIVPSLFDVHEGALSMGVPVPDVMPVFSVIEQRQYGMRSATELRLPVLHVTF